MEIEAFQNTGWKANSVLGINSGVPRKVEQVFGIGRAQFEETEMASRSDVLISFFEHVLRRQYELRRKGKKWNSREFARIFSELFDCLGSRYERDRLKNGHWGRVLIMFRLKMHAEDARTCFLLAERILFIKCIHI